MPAKGPDNAKLLVVSFDEPLRANEVLRAVARLQQHQQIKTPDALAVTRSADGGSHERETTEVPPGQAGVGAGVWGLLIGTLFGGPIGGLIVGAASAGGGALYARLVDTGIKDTTVSELRSAVPPGRSAVALL